MTNGALDVPVLSCQGLSVSFATEDAVLEVTHDISFEVQRGMTLATRQLVRIEVQPLLRIGHPDKLK